MGFEEIAYYNWIIVATVLLVLWSTVWKGIALWRAGRNSHLIWFIVLFILNTAGILEIIYIFTFGKKRNIKIDQP